MKNNDHDEEERFVSETVLDYGTNPAHYGKLERPEGHARVTGPCGDTDEIYLRIQGGRVREARFVTDGCLYSLAACNAAARLATGKPLHQCLSINQRSILDHLRGLPDDHARCALLAATTLYQAVSDYVRNYGSPPSRKPTSQQEKSREGPGKEA